MFIEAHQNNDGNLIAVPQNRLFGNQNIDNRFLGTHIGAVRYGEMIKSSRRHMLTLHDFIKQPFIRKTVPLQLGTHCSYAGGGGGKPFCLLKHNGKKQLPELLFKVISIFFSLDFCYHLLYFLLILLI